MARGVTRQIPLPVEKVKAALTLQVRTLLKRPHSPRPCGKPHATAHVGDYRTFCLALATKPQLARLPRGKMCVIEVESAAQEHLWVPDAISAPGSDSYQLIYLRKHEEPKSPRPSRQSRGEKSVLPSAQSSQAPLPEPLPEPCCSPFPSPCRDDPPSWDSSLSPSLP